MIKCWRGTRKLIRKVHPDKGGKTEDAKRLQSAKNFWDTAKSEDKKAGRPNNDGPRSSETTPDGATELADPEKVHKVYRIRACAVLLTYNGIKDVAQWSRFVLHVRANIKKWGVKHWSCTLEASAKGTLHIHLMVQFSSARERDSRPFLFEGLKPQAPCVRCSQFAC